MNTTTFGGMPLAWAQKMSLPCARMHQNLQNRIDLNNKYDATKTNLVNVVWEKIEGKMQHRLCTDEKAWKEKVKVLILQLESYQVILMIENEPSNLNVITNYTAYRYVLLYKWTKEVMDSVGVQFPLMHGGWMMPQSVRITYETMIVSDPAGAKEFKTKAKSLSVWGGKAAYNYAMDELKYFKQFGLSIMGSFHFQQYYELLPQVTDYLMTYYPDLSNTELGQQDNLPATTTALIEASKRLSYCIWYNGIEGDAGYAVTLDKEGEQAFTAAIG